MDWTATSIDADLRERMFRAFKRYREENGITTDEEAALRLGLDDHYKGCLALRRSWPSEGIIRVAAGLKCSVSEMLYLAECAGGRGLLDAKQTAREEWGRSAEFLLQMKGRLFLLKECLKFDLSRLAGYTIARAEQEIKSETERLMSVEPAPPIASGNVR